MCGLLGFIGESKNPEITKNLITELFAKTQTRGVDASGFYCSSSFDSNNVYFYKEPFPSTSFIHNKNYKELWNYDLNLGLFHCRAATMGVGIPAENKNNHPFVSEDNQKAIIHNGYISKNELRFLKSIFETNTDCDSELVLRILEQDGDLDTRLSDFFAFTEKSAFAVAYAQIEKECRELILFRNLQRPLCLIDLREELGQLFFCSTPDIFFSAINNIKNAGNIKYGICEFEPYMVAKINLYKNKSLQVDIIDISFKNDLNNKKWEFHKLKSSFETIFNSPISFSSLNQEKNETNPSSLDKLEELLAVYKKNMANFSDKIDPQEAKRIEYHARLLQNLLQKEII
jgi:predicted glutamine amidotransferase